MINAGMRLAAIWVLLSSVMICAGSSIASACELTVGWEDWEPFHYRDGAQLKGVDIDLITAVSSEAQCQLRFREVPWVRQLKLLEVGQLDVMLGASRTPEREVYAYFTETVRRESFHLLYAAAGDIASLEDVIASTKGKIGIVQGYEYSDTLSDLITDYGAKFVASRNDAANVRKLAAGRLRTALIDPYVGSALITKMKVNLRLSRDAVISEDVYFMVSRKSAEGTLSRLNRALSKLRRSGALLDIQKRYVN